MSASSVVALGLANAVIAFSRGWAQIMLRNPLHGSRSVLYFSSRNRLHCHLNCVVLFCLLVSFMALFSDPLIENGHVTQSFAAPRDNQLK